MGPRKSALFWISNKREKKRKKPNAEKNTSPECVAKGSRLTWESEGRAVFARRCF